jgi:molybdopterin-guanine dinucleotide biosynthesis protein A
MARGGLATDHNGEVDVAALLLTGGASRRMGKDKASILGADGRSLAVRTGDLLVAVAAMAIEVGPGHSTLRAVPDDPPDGPLAAVATGVAALEQGGWLGPALVVATDLPRLDTGLLTWLADHPFEGSVVPVVAGRPQWLCARYDRASLAGTAASVAAGKRRMEDLTAGCRLHLAPPDEWGPAVETPLAPVGADTPAQLAALVGNGPTPGTEPDQGAEPDDEATLARRADDR